MALLHINDSKVKVLNHNPEQTSTMKCGNSFAFTAVIQSESSEPPTLPILPSASPATPPGSLAQILRSQHGEHESTTPSTHHPSPLRPSNLHSQPGRVPGLSLLIRFSQLSRAWAYRKSPSARRRVPVAKMGPAAVAQPSKLTRANLYIRRRIWRDPDEIKIKKEREGTVKPDPTAAARSPIRRRSPPAARRRSSYYPSRQPFPPRIERSPLPSVGFNGMRDARRGEHRGVPPVSTLLESADTRSPFPRPRNAVHFRRRADAATSIAQDQRSLIDTGRRHDAQTRMENEVQRIQAEIVPGDWEDWSEEDREAWLAENNIPRYLYPRDHEVPLSAFMGASSRRSPESMLRSSRPQSRDGPRPSALPTPPHDESVDADSLFVPPHPSHMLRRTSSVRRQHPLSRSWRPESPVDGLGDRNRSPTPADNWEIMRQTITPDATLPSADSSFTSAAASLSFTSNNSASTSVTDPDYTASSNNSRRNSQEDEQSVSSVDPDDLVCNDDEMTTTAAFAEHVFRQEQSTSEGRTRIARHSADLEIDQNRYALRNEPLTVEIGFRLIDEALDTQEGRVRVFQLSESLPPDVRDNLVDWIIDSRRNPQARPAQRRTRMAHITDDEPPSPHPENYSSNTRAAVREASQQIHGFFRRFTAEETLSASQRDMIRMADGSGANSPPPRYEPLASHPEVRISQDEPEAHPVASLPGSQYPSRAASPPSARSERDVADALLSGDEQDLNAIRRVVERLAQRDDVPEEWWMSMGLNLSRTRARSRSRSRSVGRSGTPIASADRDAQIDSSRRVRTGRVERDRGTASRL